MAKFDFMKRSLTHVFLLASLSLSLFACKKEEPFEYPDDPKTPTEQLIVYFERRIDTLEGWTGSNLAQGCPGDVQNLAFYDLNMERGFATMHLVPNSDSCVLDVALTSEIKAEEITTRKWEDLSFEFTFSEYEANPGTEFWLSLYYKDLELDLDLAPHISRWIPSEELHNGGVFAMSFDTTGVVFTINGKKFTPEFETAEGNHFSTTGSGETQYVRTRLHSTESELQSFIEFKYLRISRYGIPES